jgi:hypothetical protein
MVEAEIFPATGNLCLNRRPPLSAGPSREPSRIEMQSSFKKGKSGNPGGRPRQCHGGTGLRCVAGMERCGICVSRQQGKVPISGRRSENMADMKVAENVEPLKKWDKLVKRNANGQFERGSKALAGAGRPPGSLNKTTTQLREAILGALEAAGGEQGSVG